jgi:bacterioferritin
MALQFDACRVAGAPNQHREVPMGSRAREILGMDADKVLDLLQRAFADEWLAYYQYWLGAKVCRGPMKDAVVAELNLHATEELGHAVLVADRIIQLGGTPLTAPKQWYEKTNCGYDPPDDSFVRVILEQNIKGEQCAISVYKAMMDATKDKDMVTYNMALTIMTDEVEHEEDLQSLLEDFELMIEAARR